MQQEYTAIIKNDGQVWFGWIEEISGVNCQENSYEKLIETLKVTLKEALDFNRKDALNSAGEGYIKEKVAV